MALEAYRLVANMTPASNQMRVVERSFNSSNNLSSRIHTTPDLGAPFMQERQQQADPLMFRAFDSVRAVNDLGRALEAYRLVANMTPASKQMIQRMIRHVLLISTSV